MRWHGHAYLLWHMEEHIHTHTHSHTLYLASSHANTLSCSLSLSFGHKHFATHYATRAYPQQASLFSISRTHTHNRTRFCSHTHTLFYPTSLFINLLSLNVTMLTLSKAQIPFSLSLTHSLTLSLALSLSLSLALSTHIHARKYLRPTASPTFAHLSAEKGVTERQTSHRMSLRIPRWKKVELLSCLRRGTLKLNFLTVKNGPTSGWASKLPMWDRYLHFFRLFFILFDL